MIETHTVKRWALRAALVVFSVFVIGLSIVAWQSSFPRPLSDVQWPTADAVTERGDAVTATWLGTSTLLFDDGETQILIDGAFTRLSFFDIGFFRSVSSDVATINYALSEYRMNRLAAIVPVHSHFDHAMDIGHVANRTSAVILGSESTANIARGAKVPVDQYQILADGEERQFGNFTIKLIASKHVPLRPGDDPWFPGTIDEPLIQPAPVSAWKEGISWSVVVAHPRGKTLIQGSAGFIEGKLDSEQADVVMLSIAGLAARDRAYVTNFWNQTVQATGSDRVIALHHDDYTAPFGEVVLFRDVFDNIVKTKVMLDEQIANSKRTVTIELPPFGKPISLY